MSEEQDSSGERSDEARFDDLSTDQPVRKGISPREPRICFAIESLDVGGAETHAVGLAEHFKRCGLAVFFAVMREAKGPLARRCLEGKIEVRDRLMRSRRGLGVIRRIKQLARHWHFDTLIVIECFYLNALLAYGAAKRRAGGRAFAVIHNWPSRRQFSHPLLLGWRVGLMNRLFDQVVFIAERQRRHYEEGLGIRFARTKVITTGIDVERFTPRAAGEAARQSEVRRGRRVAIVASLQPRKGHEDFLQAAAAILRRRTDVEFLVVGEGPRRAPLRQMAHQLGIEGNVHFLGIRDDVPDLLNTLDVLVLASHKEEGGHAETLPLVLLEAGAAAVPVVATDVGAVSDIVADGRTGFLVPPRNWQALAEKIERLLGDSRLRMEMGTIARERIIAKFNAKGMCDEFERLVFTGH